MKRNFLILSALILTAIFLGYAALPAYAVDGKTYPGAMGQELYDNMGQELDGIPSIFRSYKTGALYNKGSEAIRVILPVVKDNGGSIKRGKVKVIDMKCYGDDQNFSGRLVSRYMTGSTWHLSHAYTNTSSGCGDYMQTLSVGNVSATTSSHYWWEVVIPGYVEDLNHKKFYSAIVSYFVEEY